MSKQTRNVTTSAVDPTRHRKAMERRNRILEHRDPPSWTWSTKGAVQRFKDRIAAIPADAPEAKRIRAIEAAIRAYDKELAE